MIILHLGTLQKLLEKIESSSQESCGFLIGKSELGRGKVETFFAVENNSDADRSKTYTITAEDYLNAEKFANKEGLVIFGVYHSHINYPAIPSELDSKFAFPDFYYLIISLVDKCFSEMKCWKITAQRKFVEETIHIIK